MKKYEVLVQIDDKWLLYQWYSQKYIAYDIKEILEKKYPDLQFMVNCRQI